ncbi:unnamed protein product [Leptosia nina]|uniref:Uncharacterized protein n=1 Tax=Leptosia nina TaxID=320188 RepID=A0AAV1J4G4_9NEOP
MDKNASRHKSVYERVMPRVHSTSNTTLRSNATVTRHIASVRVGGKNGAQNLRSTVSTELPTVLNDFKQDKNIKPTKPIPVAKPKKTLQSLDPKTVNRSVKASSVRRLNARASAPAVLNLGSIGSSVKQEEIKAFEQLEKSKEFRGRLHKSCGVLVDESGKVAADKAVQAEPLDEALPVTSSQISCKKILASD